jgi:putative transposase
VRFIDQHAGRRTLDGLRWGVEPICRVLTDQGTPIAPSTYYDARARASRPSRRAARDQDLKTEITALHAANYGVYGARKVWLTLNRQGTAVARCTVERLMGDLGLRGAIRGKVKRTTIGDPTAKRPQGSGHSRGSWAAGGVLTCRSVVGKGGVCDLDVP